MYRAGSTLPNVSIHALRGKRDNKVFISLNDIIVSIHALRGKRDVNEQGLINLHDVSIHALRGKRDSNLPCR